LNKMAQRKADHLDILRNELTQYQYKKSGLEKLDLIPHTVSSLSWNAIQTEVLFLGKKLSMPLMISSMSGGIEESAALNQALARCAHKSGLALAMGSLRPLLYSRESIGSYAVMRQEAPDIPLIANIGFGQIAGGEWRQGLFELVDELGCDALMVHFNKIQEYFQPDGDRSYEKLNLEMADFFRQSPFPLIAKEVGHGFSEPDIRQLMAWGFRFIDVAGAGGTSWARVEALRNKENPVIEDSSLEWGVETAESLMLMQKYPQLFAIASGGIRSGEDMVKAAILGARLSAAAAPFYLAWDAEGEAGITKLISRWKEELTRALYFTGAENIGQVWLQPDFARRRDAAV
jgi:isopentenyl-diphosphate Delta-isomerase